MEIAALSAIRVRTDLSALLNQIADLLAEAEPLLAHAREILPKET